MTDPNNAEPKTEPPQPVLELKNLSYSDMHRQSMVVSDINLSIKAGELVTVEVPLAVETRAFVSMLQGLRQPHGGQVLFEGNDWLGDSFMRLDAMRWRIGRVFDGTAWIENLNIHENVVLSERHHSKRAIADIDAEVEQLAKQFGIDEVTEQRPSFVGKTYLRICEWVRAFLGSPALLLLEHPMRAVPVKYKESLIQRIEHVLNDGAAAIWFTRDDGTQKHSFQVPTRHFSISEQQFIAVR